MLTAISLSKIIPSAWISKLIQAYHEQVIMIYLGDTEPFMSGRSCLVITSNY